MNTITLVCLGLMVLFALSSAQIHCGSGYCDSYETCCESHLCCPHTNANCCYDGRTCCPLGYTCDNVNDKCRHSKRQLINQLFGQQIAKTPLRTMGKPEA